MKNSVIKVEYIKGLFDKYKYPILVLALGLLLVFSDNLFSGGKQEKPKVQDTARTAIDSVERQITQVLSQIDGVGRVTVALTTQSSDRTVYAKDSKYNSEGEEIVIISDSGNQKPLVEYTVSPDYKGAVVVCDGGGDSKVKLEVTNAIKALTGISTDHIIILKMKK